MSLYIRRIMNRKKMLKYLAIYFVLISGYMLLYVAKYEVILNPNLDAMPKSKVNFVYQQF